MSTHTTLWSEVRGVAAQWVGIVLAAILSGLLLGILMRDGINEKLSLEIALPVGFLLALLFWILASRQRLTRRAVIEMPLPVSMTVINFEVQSTATAYLIQPPTAPAIAYQIPTECAPRQS